MGAKTQPQPLDAEMKNLKERLQDEPEPPKVILESHN